MNEYREILKDISEEYEIIRDTDALDRKSEEKFLKNVINFYSNYINKKDFDDIIKSYKELYIYNESNIEEEITYEEQLGISLMYDYINNFNFETDYFNIFTTSMVLHQKLYSKCFASEFGGILRDSTVMLQDVNIDIVDATIAVKEFNSYISKTKEIMEDLENSDLISYIEKCVILTTKLIKLQPFPDGNKRTFRALLNLLLKKINLPPIYIEKTKKDIYKESLIKAMKYDEYDGLIKLYYDRIYDAIIKLDINSKNKEFNR